MDNITIQDVFEQFIPMIADRSFSDEQFNAIKCIRSCRTAEMGAHVSECKSCHSKFIHYNSCKNRNCPMCQAMKVDEWIDLRREDVLDAPYFHTVFTVPGLLYPLIYANQKLLYDALYHAANKTLSELSKDAKHFGAKIGYICILHTWGSKLNYHPHIHTIVELKYLHESEKLSYSGGAEILRNQYEFKSLLDKLYAMDWVVYSKRTFKGAQEVFKYLGKYTHRIAISNRRILSMDSENVTFSAKDYRTDGKYRPMTISGEKFVSRFLLHILPKGFVRIRYYGLLSCRCKAQKMTLCRNLLGCEQYLSKLRGKTTAEKIKILYNHDICKCSKCGEPLITFRIDGRYMLC